MSLMQIGLHAADATNTPPAKEVAPASPAPVAAPHATQVGFSGRITRLDAATNAVTLATSFGAKNVRFLPTSLSKPGGVPVRAGDFKIGEILIVRGHTDRDGFFVADYASNRLPAPTMKPAVKKEQQAPDKK